MSLFIDRLKHQTKVFGGTQLGRILRNQYARGRGPAKRLVGAFSVSSRRIGVEAKILVNPVPLRRTPPDYFLNGETEAAYINHALTGEEFTESAGVISAQDVDVSFPTSIHRIGDYILDEVIPAPYLITNPRYYYALQSMRLRKKEIINEGVLLSMPLHHNFYHWMIEILPRLILYDRCQSLQNTPLIVPKSAPKFVNESLRLAGYQKNTIALEDGVYKFQRLYMLSRLALMTEVSPDAIVWLNNRFRNIAQKNNGPKRIYVSRRDAKIRYVSNEADFGEILSEFGFETLVMSELSLTDQIGVFRNADFIIGPHGAGFANVAFAKPGSTLVEFFSKGHYNSCYNRISKIRFLKYGFLVGEPTAVGGFRISPDDLRAILIQADYFKQGG